MRRLRGLSLWILVLALAPRLEGIGQRLNAPGSIGAAAASSLPDGDRDERRPPKPGEKGPPPTASLLSEIESLEQQCLEQLDVQRKARGLSRLAHSEDLLQVARAYSRRMAEEKFFSHVDPDGHTIQQRVREARIRWTALGENLALSTGYINPVAAAFSGWMASAGHRRNILAPDYQRTAVGAWISSNGTVYLTEIFLKE